MNFFWTEKEYDNYVEMSGQAENVGNGIYKLDIYEALEAGTELFSVLKYIEKVV